MFGCAKYMGKGFSGKAELRENPLCRKYVALKFRELFPGVGHCQPKRFRAFFQEVQRFRNRLLRRLIKKSVTNEGVHRGTVDIMPARTDFGDGSRSRPNRYRSRETRVEELRGEKPRHFRFFLGKSPFGHESDPFEFYEINNGD